MSIWWLAAIASIAVLLGIQFFLYHTLVDHEIKRCHYERAVKMIDGPLGWSSTDVVRLQKAGALFYWGRAQEAEVILRELVHLSRSRADRLSGFELLGLVLLAQGRYAEAKTSFEAAAAIRSSRSVAFSGLSELRLRQGLLPGQALAAAELALKKHRGEVTERFFSKGLAGIRGNQAWALALLGHTAESEQAIELGAREVDPKHKPELAGFHWRAGMAMLAIQRPSSAADHFLQASELDTEGYYGGLARQQLREHSLDVAHL